MFLFLKVALKHLTGILLLNKGHLNDFGNQISMQSPPPDAGRLTAANTG